jgi:hypothetical protein
MQKRNWKLRERLDLLPIHCAFQALLTLLSQKDTSPPFRCLCLRFYSTIMLHDVEQGRVINLGFGSVGMIARSSPIARRDCSFTCSISLFRLILGGRLFGTNETHLWIVETIFPGNLPSKSSLFICAYNPTVVDFYYSYSTRMGFQLNNNEPFLITNSLQLQSLEELLGLCQLK